MIKTDIIINITNDMALVLTQYQLEKLNGIPSYTTPKDFSVEKECITIKK